jgi:hypothetical protein
VLYWVNVTYTVYRGASHEVRVYRGWNSGAGTPTGPTEVSRYDAASGGNVVNQVLRSFNGLGQLTAEYQSHAGAVNTSTIPAVQYAYTELAGGANNSRLTSITYPSGYVLTFNYNAGLDSSISRLSSISDSGGTLESYLYLGLGTVVERDHPQSGVNLTYVKQGSDPNANMDGGDQYTGLDRFGRVIDQNWTTRTPLPRPTASSTATTATPTRCGATTWSTRPSASCTPTTASTS